MENQLELIAKSYDRHFIEYGKEDSLSYDRLPDFITNDPDFPKWKTEYDGKIPKDDEIETKDYLSPEKDMRFIHLGCSVNLKFKGYDKWPSTYYGVDISSETIQMLNAFVSQNSLSIGSLFCGSIHETPFDDSYFDIGDCIGVLEYYENDFVEKAIIEAHRIMKPNGKLVLDIPNIVSPAGRIMMLIEEYMGRPDKFNMLPEEFEDMIKNYFEIEYSNKLRAKNQGSMCMVYYLRCKK